MSHFHYLELVSALCLRAEFPAPRHITDGGALTINGVAFSLSHHPLVDDTLLFIHADFGLLPQGRELAAALALLQANMSLANGSAPVFSVAPNTQQVLMVQHCAMLQTDDQMLLTLLTNMAGKALQWRVDYFLDAATNPFCLPQSQPDPARHVYPAHPLYPSTLRYPPSVLSLHPPLPPQPDR